MGTPEVLGTTVGILVRPTRTLRRFRQAPSVGWAILVVVLVFVVDALGQPRVRVADLLPQEMLTELAALGEAEVADMEVGGPSIASAVVSPIFALLFIAMVAGVYHMLSVAFRGQGTYAGLFSGFAFSMVPLVFGAPLTFLIVPLGVGGLVLFSLGLLVLLGWVSVLCLYAIRENYGFSTGRALLVYTIPLLAFAVLLVAFVVLVVALITAFAGALGQPLA